MPEAAPAAAPATDAPSPSLTPDQAAAKLEKMLGKGAPVEAAAKPDDEEKDQPGPDAVPDAPDAPDAAEQPAPEEEPVDEADEDNAEVEGEEVLFTVKIDGQDVPVPVSEARDGYLRRSDYSKKTAELSQQRQAFAETAQAVMQERQVYGVLIGALEEQLKSSMPQEPNWQELNAHPDKSFYWAARANWDETQRRLQAIADEKDRLGQLQQMDTTQQLTEHLDRSRAWLVEQLPAWRDESRAKADKAKIREYGLKAGFTEYDVDHAYDPRLVILAHKARLYDELVANRPKPSQGEAPSPLKPGIATHQPATTAAKLTKAKRRLAQTGRPDDAVAAIELILQR